MVGLGGFDGRWIGLLLTSVRFVGGLVGVYYTQEAAGAGRGAGAGGGGGERVKRGGTLDALWLCVQERKRAESARDFVMVVGFLFLSTSSSCYLFELLIELGHFTSVCIRRSLSPGFLGLFVVGRSGPLQIR